MTQAEKLIKAIGIGNFRRNLEESCGILAEVLGRDYIDEVRLHIIKARDKLSRED